MNRRTMDSRTRAVDDSIHVVGRADDHGRPTDCLFGKQRDLGPEIVPSIPADRQCSQRQPGDAWRSALPRLFRLGK